MGVEYEFVRPADIADRLEISEWAKVNLNPSSWHYSWKSYSPLAKIEPMGYFRFQDTDEAMLFMLVWA